MKKNNNIFSSIPEDIPDEITEQIINSGTVRIERIISNGQSSPDNFWYDQDENEWVIVLQGQAEILFENELKIISLKTGDFINIPAHAKHKVKRTAENMATIWLAVFYS